MPPNIPELNETTPWWLWIIVILFFTGAGKQIWDGLGNIASRRAEAELAANKEKIAGEEAIHAWLTQRAEQAEAEQKVETERAECERLNRMRAESVAHAYRNMLIARGVPCEDIPVMPVPDKCF